MSYERLIDEHARIDQLCTDLLTLIETDTPDVHAVVLALSDLSTELAHHLAHEDSMIYPQMLNAQNAEIRDVAIAFISEFAALRVDWGLYLGEWNGECITADWATFRETTRAIIGRLARRVEAENSVLYSAALREGSLVLRDRRRAA